MSDNTTTETTKTETTKTETTKTETTKRSSVLLETIKQMAQERGLEARELKAYIHYGHKGGVQVSVANTEHVSRVFLYRENIEHRAVSNYNDEQAKELRLGGVRAEVEFSEGADAALEAVALFLDAAKNAPAPVKAEAKPKAEKKPKAPSSAASSESTETVVEQAASA